jgi:hypothetical protein
MGQDSRCRDCIAALGTCIRWEPSHPPDGFNPWKDKTTFENSGRIACDWKDHNAWRRNTEKTASEFVRRRMPWKKYL